MPSDTDLQRLLTEAAARVQEVTAKLGQTAPGAAVASPEAARNSIVRNALVQLSKDSPAVVIAEAVGDGTLAYDLPDTWEPGVSVARAVEYPVGRKPPAKIEAGSAFYIDEDSAVLVLAEFTVPDGADFNLIHTIGHKVEGLDEATATTLNALQWSAAVALVAAREAKALAARFANVTQSTARDDVTDYKDRNNLYNRVAEELQKEYDALLATPPTTKGAAWSRVTWSKGYVRARSDFFRNQAL